MSASQDQPIVRTPDGTVRGIARGSSAAFLGIPYAAAPVGPLRFAAPAPVTAWEGERAAVAHGPTPQRRDASAVTIIPEPTVPGEEILNLDVFTPAPGDERAGLPVLVWFHGGGFVSGSIASPWYDGTGFNADGVVTVNVSYRLGFDGFGQLPDAVNNRAVLDWLAALEWVQRSIAAFGGDPARVTIAGQSAGGGAVLRLLALPQAQHLFASAWCLSGAPSDVTREGAEAATRRIARRLGVPATAEALAAAGEEALLDAQEAAGPKLSGNPLNQVRDAIQAGPTWGPVIDGELIGETIEEALGRGVGAAKPLVLGATDDEFTMVAHAARKLLKLVPSAAALAGLGLDSATRRQYLADNPEIRAHGTAAVLGHFVSDSVFRTQVVRLAETRRRAAESDAATWVYRFSWPSPVHGWASHCLDVPFFFDHLGPDDTRHVLGEQPPRELAATYHGAAVALLRDGDPGWQPWSASPGATRVFDHPDAGLNPDGYAQVAALLSSR